MSAEKKLQPQNLYYVTSICSQPSQYIVPDHNYLILQLRGTEQQLEKNNRKANRLKDEIKFIK